MHDPLLSVVMPVYNAEEYVVSAVKSVLEQTYKNIELICVNDCSKDNSLKLLCDLSILDSRVIVVDSPVNVGAGEARNIGISQTRGEYITFIDSDDTIEPDLYARAMNELLKNNVDEIVWGVIEEHFDKNNNKVKTVLITPELNCSKTEETIVNTVVSLEKNTLFGYQWNSIYRACIIKDNNIRFEKSILYEDYFFNLEFTKRMRSICTLDYAGYHYYKRVNSSITNQFIPNYFDLSYRRVKSLYDYCFLRGIVDETINRVLAEKLLRYSVSAICRNNDQKSNMSIKERLSWLKEKLELPLYNDFLKQIRFNKIIYKLLKFVFVNKMYLLLISICKIIYLLRN